MTLVTEVRGGAYDYKISADKIAFVPSKDIRVFPCGWRGETDFSASSQNAAEEISFDQEARLNTEFNLTHLPGQFGGLNTYIVDNGWPTRTDQLCFYINGYYFEINGASATDFRIPTGQEDPKYDWYKYASIRICKSVLSQKSSGSNRYDESTYVLSSCLDTNILDVNSSIEKTNDFTTFVFTGLVLTTEPPAAGNKDNQICTLQLFDVGEEGCTLHHQSKVLPIKHGDGKDTVVIGTSSSGSATGENSVAFGEDTNATNKNQFVVGKFNTTPKDGELFTVGDGASGSSRHDALIVKNGNTFLNGLALSDVFEPIDSDKFHIKDSKDRLGEPTFSSRVKRATVASYLVSKINEEDDTKYAVGTDGVSLVYFNDGQPKVSTKVVGSATQGVYLNNGSITVLDKPVYNSNKEENLIPAVNRALSGITFGTETIPNRTWTTTNTFSKQIIANDGIAVAAGKATSLGGSLTISGTTTLKNTLTVSGVTALNNTLTVGDTLTVADGKKTTLGGELEVKQGTVLQSTLTTKGAATLEHGLTVGTSVFAQATKLYGTLDVTGNTTIGSELKVKSKTTLHETVIDGDSKFTVGTGTATFGGAIKANGTVTFTGEVYVPDVDISTS